MVPSGDEGRTIPSNKELTELFKNTIKCLHYDIMFTNRNKLIRNIREIFSKTCKEKGIDPIKIMKATGHKTISMYLRYNTVTKE